jgi:hypothetical protein
MKVLFLLKERNSYGGTYSVRESGLLNSARMTMEAIVREFGVEAQLKVCIDANSIDRELHLFKPNFAIIEAIWVTPTKIKELVKLHPKVHFIIRIHSEIPFLANEGNSVEWCKEYSAIPHVYVAFNSNKTQEDFQAVAGCSFFFLPNIYEDVNKDPYRLFEYRRKIPRTVSIGCFGAIRPMKNQLQQAFSAIIFANKYDSVLFFHINSPRVEQEGHGVLKNIRSLFRDTRHVLVEHPWLDRADFLQLVDTMDAGMQVSLNESFNIVTADFIKVGVPIIVSPSIGWMPDVVKVSTEDSSSIVRGLELAFKYPKSLVRTSRKYLHAYNGAALDTWKKFFFEC